MHASVIHAFVMVHSKVRETGDFNVSSRGFEGKWIMPPLIQQQTTLYIPFKLPLIIYQMAA